MPRKYKLESNTMSTNRMNKRNSSECENKRGFVLNKSAVSNLILEINELIKKANIDEQLSNILDKFLNNLKESEKYLENGIFTINFQEASLLLEKSCVLYGKKVDILWNDVKENLQRWHSFNKSKNISDEKVLHETMNRFRGHKTVLQQVNSKNFSFNHSSLLEEAGNVPNLPQIVGSACKTLENLWSEATQSSLKLKRLRAKVAPLVFTHIKKTPIYYENGDKKLCNYHDLCLNLFEAGYMLHDDKTTQLYNLRHLIDDILQSFLAQHGIPYTKLAECNMWPDFKKYLQLNITKRLRILLKKQRERMNGGWDRKRPLIAQRPPVDFSMLHVFGEFQVSVVATEEGSADEEITEVLETNGESDVGMLPASPVKSYASRRTSEMHSEADSAFHDGSFEDDEERNVRSKHEESYKGSTATESRKTTISSDDRGYFEDSLRARTPGNDTDCINHSYLRENAVSRESWMNNNEEMEVFQEFGIYDNSAGEQESEQLIDDGHSFPDKYDDTSSNIVEEKLLYQPEDVLQQKKRKRKRNDTEVDSDVAPKRRDLMRILMTEEDKILTVPLITQENFFVRCYNSDENEGGIPPREYEGTGYDECDVDASTCLLKHEREKILASVLIDHCYYIPVSSEEWSTEIEISLSPRSINNANEIQCNNDGYRTPSPIILPPSEQVNIQKQMNKGGNEFHERISKNDINIEQFSRRKAALLDWKCFMQPKIDAASQKPDFDIHEYGTYIMDAIPLGESRNFNHVIKDKPASEVSRLFLATLQLANTNNVELENVPKGQLANGKMCIKLLSRERYHEQLEEYVAPSEKSYGNKFKQACKSLSSTSTHSSTPNKKLKIC
ncbi:uncharacterized protein LOC108737186 isoform X2 [Agrilus planipennis]|uniref:Uncharacterized protein LOC108737186 isoform X1 n=1 Tax=Agrilus planipennis TaxID=224129 RepID=A0A1W4WNA9_AGRPL|nr:uncharacterized protein LOC108737186 isoform X1 [Agrilus planipennis]XP_018325404.1 uncharacterized protein LOC108737186 isoform X2 [Agrilus planipennis]